MIKTELPTSVKRLLNRALCSSLSRKPLVLAVLSIAILVTHKHKEKIRLLPLVGWARQGIFIS